MKKILLVAATELELNTVPDFKINGRKVKITRLVTGPGIMNTAFALGKVLSQNHFDLAINIGLAGSFHKILRPGTVVHVTSERNADFGAEDGNEFLSVFDLKLMNKNEFPYFKSILLNNNEINSKTLLKLVRVKGATVNKAHGLQTSIEKIKTRLHPDVESMEGAAFFYACLMENVPFIQIRAISNLVERRNKAAWKIPLALKNLGLVVTEIIKEIEEENSNQ